MDIIAIMIFIVSESIGSYLCNCCIVESLKSVCRNHCFMPSIDSSVIDFLSLLVFIFSHWSSLYSFSVTKAACMHWLRRSSPKEPRRSFVAGASCRSSCEPMKEMNPARVKPVLPTSSCNCIRSRLICWFEKFWRMHNPSGVSSFCKGQTVLTLIHPCHSISDYCQQGKFCSIESSYCLLC